MASRSASSLINGSSQCGRFFIQLAHLLFCQRPFVLLHGLSDPPIGGDGGGVGQAFPHVVGNSVRLRSVTSRDQAGRDPPGCGDFPFRPERLLPVPTAVSRGPAAARDPSEIPAPSTFTTRISSVTAATFSPCGLDGRTPFLRRKCCENLVTVGQHAVPALLILMQHRLCPQRIEQHPAIITFPTHLHPAVDEGGRHIPRGFFLQRCQGTEYAASPVRRSVPGRSETSSSRDRCWLASTSCFSTRARPIAARNAPTLACGRCARHKASSGDRAFEQALHIDQIFSRCPPAVERVSSQGCLEGGFRMRDEQLFHGLRVRRAIGGKHARQRRHKTGGTVRLQHAVGTHQKCSERL